MMNFFKKYDAAGDNILFAYKGNPTEEKIQLILDISEYKLILSEKNRTLLKRIVHILIEVLQNVFKHREEFINIDSQSFLFYLLKYSDHYSIISGNYILNDNVANLKEKIEEYNSLSELELDASYKNVLSDGKVSDKSGGLGLMEIIRKSDRNMEFRVIPVNERISFFLMELNISLN